MTPLELANCVGTTGNLSLVAELLNHSSLAMSNAVPATGKGLRRFARAGGRR